MKNLGIWIFKLFEQNNNEIAQIQIPVFSKKLIESNDVSYLAEFNYLVKIFYNHIDSCIHYTNNYNKHLVLINNCKNKYWSTHYSDSKSEIRFGYNKTLGMLL